MFGKNQTFNEKCSFSVCIVCVTSLIVFYIVAIKFYFILAFAPDFDRSSTRAFHTCVQVIKKTFHAFPKILILS